MRTFNQLCELIHTVVELMVAKGSNVIADSVHDRNDRFALRHGADRAALNRVAAVNKGDIVVRIEHVRLIRSNIGIPGVGLNAFFVGCGINLTMHIVRIQHNDVVRLLDRRGRRRHLVKLEHLESINVLLAAIHPKHSKVSTVKFQILCFAAECCVCTLDEHAAFCLFQYEQRILTLRIHQPDMRAVRIEILAICCRKGILTGLIYANSKNRRTFRNSHLVIRNCRRCCHKLILCLTVFAGVSI